MRSATAPDTIVAAVAVARNEIGVKTDYSKG